MPRKKIEKPPERRRCFNCGKMITKNKPWQKFCTAKCRMQFNQYGGAFYPLKPKIMRAIEWNIRHRFLELKNEIAELREMVRPKVL